MTLSRSVKTMSICSTRCRIGGPALARTCSTDPTPFQRSRSSRWGGCLFQEFDSKRMSKLAGDKLVDSENLGARQSIVSGECD
ncbi:hypothetical protein TB2_009884 [Malus domestica]